MKSVDVNFIHIRTSFIHTRAHPDVDWLLTLGAALCAALGPIVRPKYRPQAAIRLMTMSRKNLHRKRSRFIKHDILKRRMVSVKKGWIYKSGGEIKTWKRRFLILTESRSVFWTGFP